MKRARFLLIGLMLSSLTLLWGYSVQAASTEPETCVKCHEDEVDGFSKSHHVKAWAQKADQSENSCKTCHGDGAEHIKAEGKVAMPAVFKGENVNAKVANESCLKCHNTSGALAFWEAGHHGKNDLTCGTCHNLHKPGQIKPTAEVCFGCHKNVRNDAQKQSHHPIIEGKVNCWDCHNTHGTLSHGMLKAESINQLCYKCHTDKRGPYLYEHPPVEENCMTCHASHGSRVQKLLVEKTPNLCQNCHEWSRHPGTPVDGTGGFTSTTGNNRLVARACLNCHAKIHGSFAPTNPAFQYNAGSKFIH